MTTNASKDEGKVESLLNVGGIANGCSLYRDQGGEFFKRPKPDLPYDPATLLLGMCRKG